MRPTALLRQVAAGAQTQRKLPLPDIGPSRHLLRLTQPSAGVLPSAINCPTTLPPVFIAPKEIDRTKHWAVAKIIYHKAKSYYQFYKAGIKQFNSNRKIRKILRPELMRQFKNINVPGSANIAMSRSEFQLMIRTKRDWRKMPCILDVFVANISVWSCRIACRRVHARNCMDLWISISSWDLYYNRAAGQTPKEKSGRFRSKEVTDHASCNTYYRTSQRITPTDHYA